MMSKSSMIPALTSCLKLHDIKGFQNGAQKMQLLYCTNIIVKFCEGTVIVVTAWHLLFQGVVTNN